MIIISRVGSKCQELDQCVYDHDEDDHHHSHGHDEYDHQSHDHSDEKI